MTSSTKTLATSRVGVNDMDLILNELSIHGQFHDLTTLRQAIGRIMTMRSIARRFGREIYCHTNASNATFSPGVPLVQLLSHVERGPVLSWLGKQGPFWDDAPQHDPSEWFECDGEVVTDTGLAEAAYCSLTGIDRRTVSLSPSDWEYSPLTVVWRRDSKPADYVSIGNYWDPPALEADLRQADPALESWRQLESLSLQRFQRLTFAADSFSYLQGQPFAPGAASRIISRLDVLDRLCASVDPDGRRSPQGQRLYEDHFIGDRAWFSDSSDSEKREFRRRLTFRHPDDEGQYLFCTWHGKVNHPPFRIHFSWPVTPGGKLYVVYVGLKITRR